jgi:hypothetical protein
MSDITEREFQKQVLQLASMLGWRAYHPQLSKWSEKGWPDLVLARPPRLLFVELKSDRGKVSPHQDEWLRLLTACGQEAAVWRPADFDAIARVLQA